jgi:ATPase subunit of ABC transporter with duplicated ATPase domains
VPIASLHARSITVSRGPLVVLDGVDLSLTPERRVGLVGPNGVGKSTLLGALAGVVALDAGTVQLIPPTATVGLLRQEPERSMVETVRTLLARRTGVDEAQRALDATTAALAAGATGADDAYAAAIERWLALGAADLDARIGEVWADLGLSARLLDQPTASLSGGEAARAGLAALVLSRFDVYLLDEPTNDLDLDGLDRLEQWIGGLQAAVALVSHDRTFLARTVTHVVELDEFTHRPTEYAGGWQGYLDERATARRRAWERFEAYDAQRRGLARRAQREREWASQGLSRARKDDEPDKNIRAFKINQTEQRAGKAARTEKQIERLAVVDKPRQPWQLRLTIADAGRSGDIVCRLVGATVTRGSFVLGPIDLTIGYGERIAVVGANGSGKTTLLDAVLGRCPLDRGERWWGASVVVGEVEQARQQLAGPVTLLRTFVDATGSTTAEARTLLAKFGLVGDHVERAASSLSPGERTRASLAVLMANGANLLVLDEPTNHLDLPAIEQLEAALDTFAGTVLLVTHDRSLLEHVRLTGRVMLVDGRVVADHVE